MNEWQTIEEFKKNPVERWCWISIELVDMAYYTEGIFYMDDFTQEDIFDDDLITHVMPIIEPSYPTEPQMLIL